MDKIDSFLVVLGILIISLLLIFITFENKAYFDIMVSLASISGFLLTLYEFTYGRKKRKSEKDNEDKK